MSSWLVQIRRCNTRSSALEQRALGVTPRARCYLEVVRRRLVAVATRESQLFANARELVTESNNFVLESNDFSLGRSEFVHRYAATS